MILLWNVSYAMSGYLEMSIHCCICSAKWERKTSLGCTCYSRM